MVFQDADQEDNLDLADVLQGLALGLFGVFLSSLLKLSLPLALLQPAWQQQFTLALRGVSILALLGAISLLLAHRLHPDAFRLARQTLWVRRLAIGAALGFLLLIPLYTYAGLRLINAGNSNELRALAQLNQVAAEIQKARTEDEMKRAIIRLPGAPASLPGRITRPLNEVRTEILAQLRPQISRLEVRLSELRSARLQSGLLGWFIEGTVAFFYAVCFAAIGQWAPQDPTLLHIFLWLPAALRHQFTKSAPQKRNLIGVDEEVLSSLQDEEDRTP
jgi:hypothetical protein